MSARAGVRRVGRPGRRSLRPGGASSARREALERLLAETDLAVRRKLQSVRERHPLEAAGGTDLEDRIQADLPREIDASLLEKEADLRRLIEDALRRGERRGPATCSRCGEPIGRARLKAVPFTDVCRECKDEEETATRAQATRHTPMIAP